MRDTITITGTVGTKPEPRLMPDGSPVTDFRVASNQRKKDASGTWVDANTSWYKVEAYGTLATHAVASIEVGQRVVVSGRIRVENWTSGDKSGTTVTIAADALGHDLRFGTAKFAKSSGAAREVDDREAAIDAAEESAASDGWPADPALAPAS